MLIMSVTIETYLFYKNVLYLTGVEFNSKMSVAIETYLFYKNILYLTGEEYYSKLSVTIETYLFYKNILYLTGEEYNSKMFLDCCGLVRQVVRDLASDFGFVIGPWNQAYMFDTLPKDVKEEDMKQGDLVFMSGTYVNPNG